ASEKRVSFRGLKATEDDSDSDDPLRKDKKKKKVVETKEKMPERVERFPYRKVPAVKPVVEVPPLPARYFRQEEKKKNPAYKHLTKVEEGVDLEELLSRFEGNQITLTQKELLALAPRLREAMKDNITKKRVPTKDVAVLEEITEEKDDGDQESEDEVETTCKIISINALMALTEDAKE